MLLACIKWKECGQMFFGVSEVSCTLNNKASKNLNNIMQQNPTWLEDKKQKPMQKVIGLILF